VIRSRAHICVAVALATAALAVPASAATGVQLTPVGRVPFPQRAYVLDLPRQVRVGHLDVTVHENGRLVHDPTITPVGASGIRFGAVLAIDSSLSMKGAPFAAALGAARTFIDRRAPNQQVALVAFTGHVHVVQRLTSDASVLHDALSRPPALEYGTRIFDALGRSLALLEHGRISAGSIVLLSDGADVGSTSTLAKVVARAKRDGVRIFTVGLRSKSFKAGPLMRLATETGGSFTETTALSQLAPVYGQISGRLASEYLLEYRSSVAPGTAVHVSAEIAGLGAGKVLYTAPKPSELRPFHRSLLVRFLVSPLSLVVLSLLAAVLVGGALLGLLRAGPESDLVGRIGRFGSTARAAAAVADLRRHRPRRGGDEARGLVARFWARLENDFELGGVSLSPGLFVLGTALGTVVAVLLLSAVAKPLVLLAALVPVLAFSWVGRRVKGVRDRFADQLPETLQLLASALRSGHSLIGALSVVVENAPEPTKREFRQVLTDDQIGLPLEGSLRRIATRMKNRDMSQVSLLAELQKTAGGNAADVLDAVVSTVRERGEIRRLARTLTVQGRMARWILSVLPLVLALVMLLLMPAITKPLFQSTGGQIALVFAALLVVVGSFWIQRIVEIEV
jgi:tight adherence protein B